MPINAELQKWLVEKAYTNLSPEEQQAFNSIIGKEAVAEQLNRAWMAPPDYNRKMNELQEKEKQLNTELQNHIATLQQWRTGTEAEANRQVEEIRAQHQRDVAALRAQIEAEGLQPSVAQPAKPNGAVPPANGNGQKYLSSDDIQRMVQAELSKAAMLPALTTQIVEKHRELFGKVPDMAQVTDTALRTGRSLQDTWREMYKVGDREVELQQAAIQKQIEDGVNERLAKLQADGAMSQQNFTGRPENPSPIRQMLMQKQQADANSPLAIPQAVMQQSEGVNAAVEALRSGKYAYKYPGQS
jgi:hypothetical protein